VRETAFFDLPLEELDEVAGDAAGGFVGGFKRRCAVGAVGADDADDFFERDLEIRRADALICADDRNGFAMWREAEVIPDIVHAFQVGWLRGVYFKDDLVRAVDPGAVVADGRTGDDAAVFKDGGDFDDGEVDLAGETIFNKLSNLAEVHVDVVDLAGVDALAHVGVALIGETQVNAVDFGEGAIEFGAGRCAGKDVDLEGLAVLMGFAYAPSEGHGHGFWVSRAGETAHADLGAGMDEGGCFVSAHDTLREGCVQDSVTGGWDRRHVDEASADITLPPRPMMPQ